MAIPRCFIILVVFPALLEVGYGAPGDDELDTACSEIDQDDTGLMQSPHRSVEVSKARGIVGNSVGRALPPTQVKVASSAATSQSSAFDKQRSIDPSATDGASRDASATPSLLSLSQDANAPPINTAAKSDAASPQTHVLASVETLHPVATSASASAAAAAAASATRKGEATTASQQTAEAPAGDAQAGLSFFQIGQETESATQNQDSLSGAKDKEEDSTNQDDVNQDEFILDKFLIDGDDAFPVPAAGEEAELDELASETASATEVQDDSPGWVTQVPSFTGCPQAFLFLGVAVALVVNSMIRWRASSLQPRDALSAKMRKKLECMPVATGLEVRSFCAVDGGSSDKFMIPGMLMRIQGCVVSKATAPLVAPLSGRSCSLYSASVSQHRHDGVHQPPVAFASAARDFTVQLEDCPEMFLEINSQDVFLFDMEAGRYASEVAFGESPDSWRGFMLENLTPGSAGCGAKGQSMDRVDLGAKGPLNFRECALVVGSRVTCIGEVVREHNGKLRLSPWSPPLPQDAAGEAVKSKTRKWLTPEADPWLHKLMISDDSRLLAQASQLPLPGKNRSCS